MSARRNRSVQLSRLEQALDANVVEERRQAVRALLGNPLIPSTDARHATIRKHAEWIRNWFSHHAEWQLTVTAEAARLRKTPADPDDGTRPCRSPKTDTQLARRGYVYLCLSLATLTRADRQTTLGSIAREIGSHIRAELRFEAAGIGSELDSRDERRELVGAIRLLLAWGVLGRVHDDEERFVRDQNADALYNVNRPVLARIMATANPPSLVSAKAFEERLGAIAELSFDESEESRHRRWRTRLFRRLLDDPVLYYDTLSADEKAYLDRQRGSILQAIEDATGLVREVRSEGIAMVDPTGRLTDYSLPEEGTEGHLTLLIAEHLSNILRETPERSVALEELVEFTRERIRQHRKRWRKDVSEPGQDRALTEEVVNRLRALSLVETRDTMVLPRPALGRYGLKPDSEEMETHHNLPCFEYAARSDK